MRYYVTLEGRTFEVDLEGEAPSVDGRPVAAALTAVPGTRTHHLLVDGRSHTLVARRGAANGWALHLDGERYDVDVVDERTRAIQAMTGQGAAPKGPRPIRAPMPGMVVRVSVGPGDRVEAGQSVLIIEAMKMENELKAEASGVVASVSVEAGQAVEKGATLVEFQAEEEASDG